MKSELAFFQFYLLLLCICVSGVFVSVQSIWSSEGNFLDMVLSFHHRL